MTPILFGRRDRQLFGIHVPARGTRLRQGAVICPPWGQEYEQAHRACRILAERMATNGYDVLRFDYYGTGDSAGASEAITFDGCVVDTIAAVDEICALANVRRVALVGLRVGSAIADRAAARVRAVSRLVLWDPVLDGRAYLSEMLAAPIHESPSGARYLLGYPFTKELECEIRDIQAESFGTGRVRDILLIVSEERDDLNSFHMHLKSTHDKVALAVHVGPRSWVEQSRDLGAGAVPVELIDHIATWEN